MYICYQHFSDGMAINKGHIIYNKEGGVFIDYDPEGRYNFHSKKLMTKYSGQSIRSKFSSSFPQNICIGNFDAFEDMKALTSDSE